ncbi:MAG: arylsulfatase [Bryobacterales bacterium]|nr:arylsulfatase [Bryobacterales bacterium]
MADSILSRRQFLAASAALPALASPSSAADARPNIVFILADDLGYGIPGCYGQKRIKTPVIDQMAAEGMRFTDAYAGTTVCAPSRCSLMTGKHTGHATVRGNAHPAPGLDKAELSVAEVLKRAGYRTALFGKWGLGGFDANSHPNDRGFDEFFGYLDQRHAHNSFPGHLWNNKEELILTENWFDRRKIFSNSLFSDKAVEFVGKQSSGKPFFLYLAYTTPHANNERGQIDKNGIDSPDFGEYAGENWPDAEKAFAAITSRMDRDIGRLLTALKERGLDENTLVIFTSDNGPHREGHHDPDFFDDNGPLRGIKRDLYEGGIRIPSVARWPGVIKPGVVSDYPWAFWDFLPTAAALANTHTPSGLDGISIVPVLKGTGRPKRSHFYWEFHERGFHQAIRQDEWKLVRQGPAFKTELYNLRDDIGETNDISAAHPEVTARLSKLLQSSRTESHLFPTTHETPVVPF